MLNLQSTTISTIEDCWMVFFFLIRTTDSDCFLPDELQVISLVFPSFTPADCAPLLQPWGIIVAPVWDKKDFSQIESFLRCYLLLVVEHLFANSWQFGTRHSFLSQPLSCWWCWCEVSSSGAGLARRGPSHSADGNFSVMNDFVRIELTRVTELIESSGGLTGRLNIGLRDWTSNALTVNWLCHHFFFMHTPSSLRVSSSPGSVFYGLETALRLQLQNVVSNFYILRWDDPGEQGKEPNRYHHETSTVKSVYLYHDTFHIEQVKTTLFIYRDQTFLHGKPNYFYNFW